MKKILKLLVSAFFVFSLIFTGCDLNTKNQDNSNTSQDDSSDEDEKSDDDAADDDTTDDETDDDGEEENTYTYTPVDDSDLEAMTAQQFTKLLGNGINLGNTMEATNNNLGFDAKDATVYEQSWGQPVTTKEMFVAMKAAGFDAVRIPVAWTNTMDWSRGDFTINQNYLERVATVVNYALDSGLYVMINDHWDYQWWGLFSHNEELAWKIYKAIWSQVGEYFKDYDYRLIFEGGNEELGTRFNDVVNTSVDARLDSSVAKYTSEGTLTTAQCYAMNTKVNQYFVDLIRSQGSKNAKRFLLIPGYDTDFDKTCSSSFVMPTDSTNSVSKLLVSVHYYLPSLYAIADQNTYWNGSSKPATYASSWGTDAEIDAQNAYFYEMKKFIDAGYGVIIGEYGAAKLNGKKKDGMEEWITNILDNCDTYNYCPFLWDCNTFFSKTGTLGFTDSEIAAVYKNRNYEAEKAGTSDGGTIDYGIKTLYSASSTTLTRSDGSTDFSKTITLSSNVSVTKGQTVSLKFERPAITTDWAGHVLRLYDDSGNLINDGSTTWCTKAEYPAASQTSITIEFTAIEDCTIAKFNLSVCSPYGSDATTYTTSSMTISNISISLLN